MYFAISYFLPLEKDKALHLNKVQSPLLKDALCQVWVKSAQWLWRRRFFNFVNVFSVFRNYLPLEKSYEQTWIPFTQGNFVPSLVNWNWPRRWKCHWKVYRQTTDDRWSEKLAWAFSSGELKKRWSLLKYWRGVISNFEKCMKWEEVRSKMLLK